MAIISKITTQKKNKQRYNIFLDHGEGEEYAFSVDEAIIISFQLRKGLEITGDVIKEIQYEDAIRKGYSYALNYLSYRMRSKKEVSDYLLKKELEKETIKNIIDRLTEENYLNDLEFSLAYVRSRLNLTIKGPEIIKRELMDKGISEMNIAEALKLFTYEEQLEKAMKLLQKKFQKNEKTSRSEQGKKMFTLVLSKGFSQEIAKEVVQRLREEETEDDFNSEWKAITYQGEKALKKYQKFEGWQKKQKIKQFLYQRGFSIELIEKYMEEVEGDQ